MRLNFRRALRCAPGMVYPVANHEQFLELIFAVGGPGLERSYDRVRSSADGKALLRERPDIVEVLTDTGRLRAAPSGSLGHAYLDFMAQNRLDASLYDNTHHDLPAIADRLGWDDEFRYVVQRGIALHDLMHVLGGYGPDVGGEFGVLGFTHGQVEGWVTGGAVALLLALPLGVGRADRLQWWKQSVRRGRSAGVLFATPFEEMIDDPLDEVRHRLRVEPIARAHPDGQLYSAFQFGSSARRSMDQSYAPYTYDPDRSAAESREGATPTDLVELETLGGAKPWGAAR